MSYIVTSDDTSPARPRRRRWLWVLLALVVLAAVVAAAFLAGRTNSHSQPPAPGNAPAAPQRPAAPPQSLQSPFGTLHWQNVGELPVPVSDQHGPREQIGGAARGFTHDAPGAMLAALNITNRMSVTSQPGTAADVIQNQTYGDQQAMLQQLSGSGDAPGYVPNQYWAKVTSGDPRSGLVQVTMLAQTPETAQSGSYMQRVSTMRWTNEDWQMQVPPQDVSTTTVDPASAGYQQVGAP